MHKSLLVLFCIASPALAQLSRTAVSVSGSDLNTCAVSSPCRSFAAAYLQTTSGGEIVALDSGGYGTLNIYKSVMVVAAPGVYAGVTVPGGANGFWIAAGTSDKVIVRGVTFNAAASASPIYVNSGGFVAIENVLVDASGGNCITVSVGSLSVTDSALRNCFNGIVANGNSPTGPRVTVSRVTVVNNVNGAFAAFHSAYMTVRDSVAISGNAGFAASSNNADQAVMNVENCAAINQSGGGAESSGNAILRISNSLLTDNVRGLWVTAGGVLETFGNNEIRGNTTDAVGTPTAVSSN
jgi:hypothetical protein